MKMELVLYFINYCHLVIPEANSKVELVLYCKHYCHLVISEATS